MNIETRDVKDLKSFMFQLLLEKNNKITWNLTGKTGTVNWAAADQCGWDAA